MFWQIRYVQLIIVHTASKKEKDLQKRHQWLVRSGHLERDPSQNPESGDCQQKAKGKRFKQLTERFCSDSVASCIENPGIRLASDGFSFDMMMVRREAYDKKQCLQESVSIHVNRQPLEVIYIIPHGLMFLVGEKWNLNVKICDSP